ncbi:hypothetical protein [Clostridium perfringens]|uniref:hypothetical protein n=1 Tax=Clostridium perfringens TaxID=1502 RepID=UPI001CC9134E|nr:hypothetical protein [Clostridium perfringens]MDZ5129852.1 hypothetical protein [Clostridium perfringens]UBK56480.1 hypothetical protein KLF47_04435 [Clostridium perfringens]
MKIKNRDYPHPVLSIFNDDYKKSKFLSELTIEQFNETIKIKVDCNLKSKTLSKLIKEKQASYLIHLECVKTRFRKSYTFNEESKEFNIDSKIVDDSIEVIVLIIANERIEKFTSEELNDYFSNMFFEIDKGDVLAVAEQYRISINKKQEGIKSLSSIFTFKESEDKRKMLLWNINDRCIDINISKEYFIKYNLLKGSNAQYALGIIFILPVLSEILTDMKNDEDAYENFIWADSIKDSLNRIGCKLDEDACISNIAYKLLEEIMDKSIDCIENGGSN